MRKSELRSIIREEMINILSESVQPRQMVNEMASLYRVVGDPEKSKQVIKLLKDRVPQKGTAMEILDALEKEGEADLYKLKAAKSERIGKEIPIQAYNTTDLKQILENPAVSKYIEKGDSPSTGRRGRQARSAESLDDLLAKSGL